jgi:hypothetical protein
LIHGPLEGHTTVYQIHFFWMGHDPDGKIEYYEYTVVVGDPIGFDPADTTGLDKWTQTKLTDIGLSVTADEIDTTVTINYNTYAKYSKTHTFFVRAADNDGMRSEALYRSFTAFTLAPYIFITEPPPEPTVDTQFLTPTGSHMRPRPISGNGPSSATTKFSNSTDVCAVRIYAQFQMDSGHERLRRDRINHRYGWMGPPAGTSTPG